MPVSNTGSNERRTSAVANAPARVVALPPRSPDPPDPARLAVARMLSHALAGAGATLAQAGADGVVTVILLPASVWSRIAVKEWKGSARNGQAPADGFGGTDWYDHDWACWAPEAVEPRRVLEAAADHFAQAVAKGRHCAGITPDLSWLPRDVVDGADYTLVLRPLTGPDVLAVAEALAGDPPIETMSDEEAAALTPRLLRLACRPSQTADAYVRKLKSLLAQQATEAEVTEPSIVTVREGPTLERLHGMPEAVAWGMNLEKDVERYRSGQIPWSAVDRGLLLSGPTGCGKTLFARALAASCMMPLVTGSYGQWLGTGGGHQGDLLRSMRQTFAEARSSAPSILFVDEIDSFPNRSTITHHYADWEMQVVNALLAEIDGAEARDGVVLVAACNHPDRLDPALIRSGRLDRHLRIGLPDRAALEDILREHLGEDLPRADLSVAALAAVGSNGADCERFVRGARRRARNADRPMIVDDLMREVEGPDDRTAADLRISAVHEAGHAIAVCELEPTALVSVSLLNDNTTTMGATERRYFSARDIHRRLVIILAGRAAEEVLLGCPSSGAGGDKTSDLATATKLVVSAAAALGLDRPSGLLWLDHPNDTNLSRLLERHPTLAERVRIVIGDGYVEALALIRRRAGAVKDLAMMLTKKRVISGEEVTAFLASYPTGPEDGAPL